jgi:hypothetical protein
MTTKRRGPGQPCGHYQNSAAHTPGEARRYCNSQPRNHHVESAFSLDKLDDLVVEERSVGAYADLWGGLGQFRKSPLEQRDRDRRNADFPGVVAASPTILCPPFEAQQRKIGGAPAFLGVVAHGGLFLTAIDRQDGAIQVEHRAAWPPQKGSSPAIVQLEQPLAPGASQPSQEASQGGGVRVSGQTCKIVKYPVVAQRFGRLDPTHVQDERIEQGFQRFADTVAVVSLAKADVPRKGSLQTKTLKEMLDERHATELRETNPIGGDAKIPWPSGHWYKTPLLVRYRSKGQNTLGSQHLQGFRASA